MKSCDFLKTRLDEAGFLDNFFNAILDKTQGTTSEVALKNFTTEFSQKLNLFISQGIKTGKIDKNNLTTLDPNTGNPIVPTPPAGTPPTTTDTDSIAEYTYKYINNIYKPDFDQKEKKIYITLLNDLQARYATDGGRDALGKLGALLFDDGTQKSFKKDTGANRPNEATPMPIDNIEVIANVGNSRQKFSFDGWSKIWMDQSGRPVTDAKSIDSLNDIANKEIANRPKPPNYDFTELTPYPSKDVELNTKYGKIIFKLKPTPQWTSGSLPVTDLDVIEKLNQVAQKKAKSAPAPAPAPAPSNDFDQARNLLNKLQLTPKQKRALLSILNAK